MTQTTAPKRCDNCGSLDHTMTLTHRAGNPPILCPRCTARESLGAAAEAHLHALLWPVVVEWAKHWRAAGMSEGALATALLIEGAHWHPEGAMHRDGDSFALAADAIREALGEVPVN